MKRRNTSLAAVVRFTKRRAPIYVARAVVHSFVPSIALECTAHHAPLSMQTVAHTLTDTATINALTLVTKILVHL